MQNDRGACSLQELQELELQMSGLNKEKKMQNNSLAIKSNKKLLIKLIEQRRGSYSTGRNANSGVGSNTMSNQEVTPQNQNVY